MEYWYLWVIFAVLCIATVVVIRFASKALQLHNDDKNTILNNLKRLKELKDKYSDLTPELAQNAEPLELLEGVTAVMQAEVEKSENPRALFNSLSDPQKIVYTLNYFVEDVRESLSFFYKNNGEPLVSVAHHALDEIGLNELSCLASMQFSMYDENNEDVSIEIEKMKESDLKFKGIYNEQELLKKVKDYIINNVGSFNLSQNNC